MKKKTFKQKISILPLPLFTQKRFLNRQVIVKKTDKFLIKKQRVKKRLKIKNKKRAILRQKRSQNIFKGPEEILSVADLIEETNNFLQQKEYRIKGEVGRVQKRGRYAFFTFKDLKEEVSLNCFVWGNVLKICGVELEEGKEMILEGFLEVFARTGGLNFQVKLLELVGEGVLKKAFEELKNILEKEGLFSLEIKKTLPDFPVNIGLITSKHGEAINDFLANVGQFGFKIKLKDCRVEGKRAIFDLIKALNFFNQAKKKVDVIVLIRGGGSWESLQAFNNEEIARMIRASTIPIIVGVGHEGDVTIADLVADFRASTPTGVAKKISEKFIFLKEQVFLLKERILNNFFYILQEKEQRSNVWLKEIKQGFDQILNDFSQYQEVIIAKNQEVFFQITQSQKELINFLNIFYLNFSFVLKRQWSFLTEVEKNIILNNPERLLKSGYVLSYKRGKLLKSSKKIQIKDKLILKFWDGKVTTKVENFL